MGSKVAEELQIRQDTLCIACKTELRLSDGFADQIGEFEVIVVLFNL